MCQLTNCLALLPISYLGLSSLVREEARLTGRLAETIDGVSEGRRVAFNGNGESAVFVLDKI